MAIQNLPFQPIQFEDLDFINCNPLYKPSCATVIPVDDLFFQWKSLPCGPDLVCDPYFTSELIVNGHFTGTYAPWTLGAGWGWTDVGAKASFDGSVGTGNLMETFTLGDIVPGTTYVLAFDCRIVGVGDTISPMMNAVAGGLVSGPVNARQFQFFVAPVGADRITFTPSGAAFGAIDNVSLVPLSGCWFATKEFVFEDGMACHTVGLTGELDLLVTSVDNTGYYQLIVSVIGVTTGTMTIHQAAIPIGTITANGTYTFYFNAPTGTFNIDFDTDETWDGCVTEGHLYELADTMTVELVDMDNVLVLDISAQVLKFEDRFWIAGAPLVGLGIYDVCLKIKVTGTCTSALFTNCLNITIADVVADCTTIVSGYKQEAGYSFGFYFNGEATTFKVQQRVKLCRINPFFPTSGSDYTFSSNVRRTTSAGVEMFWEFIFAEMGVEAHSAVPVQSQLEIFTINDIEYFAEAKDYKPLWDGKNYTSQSEGRLIALKQGDIARK